MKAADWLEANQLRAGVIVIGLGGNLGGTEQVRARMRRVVSSLSEDWGPARFSDFYLSAPIGPVPDQNDFVNAVAAFRPEPSLAPEELLFAMQRIEIVEGRVRSEVGGPRTLDLDLLLVGDETRSHEALQLPHPRMHERAFVLVPLCDLFGAAFTWHGVGQLEDRLADLSTQRIERMGG